ncbi:MAG TPA: glycosyltransferase [Thermoanaerobaculia bacterium]|jgi:glycosyltransferase involved in cell wall biosynthesis|nr:glycosyltransferase [Thermoanaerobaculia bacterium]
MIRIIASVIRGEGLSSALRRTGERIGDALHGAALRVRGTFDGQSEAGILNVAASGTALRLGGVQAQLAARLRVERGLRSVALLSPGLLEQAGSRRIATDLEAAIREAIAITGAGTVHFEGMFEVPLRAVMRLIESGIGVIASLHDFSLFCSRPHLIEEPMGSFCFYSDDFDRCQRCLQPIQDVPQNELRDRRALAREILVAATGVIVPSQFLLEQHRQLFSLPDLVAEVVEPGVPAPARPLHTAGARRAIAYAGSLKRHKGAHLLPDLARVLGNVEIHVFGGGDEDLLRAIRRVPNITVHGYYRGNTLPALLARFGIGLVVLPSIWPETYSLALSEAWIAGAAVAAFDLGAPAERIRRHGGGWLAPLESGAEGLGRIIEQWRAGLITTTVPPSVPEPEDAAHAHLDLYRKWGVL